jgi:signal transduction histidine kinase
MPMMHTDRVKVKQILLNLLSNAIKFTHEGEIAVTARQAGETVEMDVRDTGIGIEEHHREAIWEDFRQVDQSITREFGGSGLGLSITRKLVDALGGEIRVQSEFGVGSTFTVVLPLRSQLREGDQALTPMPAAADSAGKNGGSGAAKDDSAPPSPS